MAADPFSTTLTDGRDTRSFGGFPFDIPLTVHALGGNDDITVSMSG